MPISLQHLLDTAVARVTRSTAIQPLLWLVATLILLVFVALAGEAPTWLLIWAVVLFTIVCACGVGAFFYLLVNDRDALRSEKFTLDKMRIERGLVGDSAIGLREAARGEGSLLVDVKLLPREGEPD